MNWEGMETLEDRDAPAPPKVSVHSRDKYGGVGVMCLLLKIVRKMDKWMHIIVCIGASQPCVIVSY